MNFKRIVLGSVLIAASAVMAEEIKLNTPEAWQQKSLKAGQGGCLVAPERQNVTGKLFNVDPAKKYTFKVSLRAQKVTGNDKSQIYVGFSPIDKNGRTITCISSNAISGTFTTVTSDAKKGDTFLMVKDGSKFKPAGWHGIVGDAKADFSDLPNCNLLVYGVGKAEKVGENWKINLTKPLTKDVKAGTAVREHSAGGYIYRKVGGVGTNWENWVGGSMKGVSTGSSWGHGGLWPRGTVKAQPIMLINFQNKKLETQIKDAVIVVE